MNVSHVFNVTQGSSVLSSHEKPCFNIFPETAPDLSVEHCTYCGYAKLFELWDVTISCVYLLYFIENCADRDVF